MKRIVTSARRISATFALCAVMAIASSAQTLTTIYTFCGATCPNGLQLQSSHMVPAQGADGNFYGTTEGGGGAYAYGTVFKITPTGSELKVLHGFCSQGVENYCPDGADPMAGLVLAANGNFYGTNFLGGTDGLGTVFTMTPSGKLTPLSNLCEGSGCPYGPRGTWGQQPVAALIQATNGDLYGTTQTGPNGDGTVFKMTPAGTLTILYTFCAQSGCLDSNTVLAGLVQASNGDLYGTTMQGGVNCPPYGCGTVFKMTLGGELKTLYSFCSQGGANCTDGQYPTAGLVQGTDGNLYGTTPNGGAYGGGTVFKMTPGGELKTLYSFDCSQGCSDGAEPFAGLVQGTDGNFYGTTSYGGVNNTACNSEIGCGTVFKITSRGALTTVYSFCSQPGCADGSFPEEGLVQGTDGSFYGTTSEGSGYGTLFSLNVGLGAFVKTVPTSGEVGAKVTILGNNLAGATSVTFNGTPATPFTVNSTGSAITTAVPAGATSGTVQVVTPGGTLSSNVTFRVLP
jgi:uncharacterized repeat protein (TIGR03803 family)